MPHMLEECIISLRIKAKSQLFSHLGKLGIDYMCWKVLLTVWKSL